MDEVTGNIKLKWKNNRITNLKQSKLFIEVEKSRLDGQLCRVGAILPDMFTSSSSLPRLLIYTVCNFARHVLD